MKPKASVILVLGAAVLAAGVAALMVTEWLGSSRVLVSDARPRQAGVLEAAETLYDGKLGAGWEDWGWGPHELSSGPAKVAFTNFGGILLHHAELKGPYAGLAFRYKAPAGWPDFLQVSLRWSGAPDTAFPTVAIEPRHVAVLPDEWREVLVDWKALNPEGHPLDRVMISSHGSVGSDWVLLDRIILTKAAGDAAGPTAGDRAVALRVNCDGPSRRINELIYGGSSDEWSTGQSARRIGGNPLSRANWELGAWNTGKDWYFENVGNKRTMFEILSATAGEQRKIALVVPMIGWVAKDKSSSGFPRASFGDQAQFDPYRPEAGNGIRADGSFVEPGPPTQTSLSAPPELIEQWVRKLVAGDTARGSRSVAIYILDNEPSLWNVTHRDVQPRPLGYDQLLERTIAYASAIRRADPGALIAGPAEWGWLGYQKSAVDREAGRNDPDRKAHGDVALVAWYLRKLAEYEKATGTRLLDVLDLHFYPAADGMYENAKTDTAASELRLRSTRALWDPTYRDESWIAESIQLIPRMRAWVKENYPGRQLMIGEWSFGADAHISGGLAAAEAFGRFGQHDLDAAFFWGQPKPDSPIYWAFRAFRDFDGKGARFQDFSLSVKEAQNVSLFASRNEARDRIVLVLLNREPLAKVTAKISLPACGGVVSTRLFRYDAQSKALDPGTAETSDGAVAVALEPFSLAVLELELKIN